MPWQLYTLVSISTYTILNVLQRKLAVNSQSPRAAAALFTLLGGSLVIGYVLVTGEFQSARWPTVWQGWAVVGLGCLLYGLFERGRFFAAKELEASVFNTLASVSLIISVVGGVVFFGERWSLAKLIGTILIFVALWLVSYEHEWRTLLNKKTALGLGVGTILGLAWLADKAAVGYLSPSIYSAFGWTLPTLVIMFPQLPLAEVKKEWELGTWKLVLLAALNVTGYVAQVKALEQADISLVMPFIQTSVLLTVILAAVFLNERQRLGQKLIAAGLAVAGVFLLV